MATYIEHYQELLGMLKLIRTSKNLYLNSVVSVEVQDTSSEEVVGSTQQPV